MHTRTYTQDEQLVPVHHTVCVYQGVTVYVCVQYMHVCVRTCACACARAASVCVSVCV